MGALDGKVALITGAASGIGLATAQLYAREGARVAMADRNADGVQEAARALGDSAVGISADVTSESDVEAMVASCIERFGGSTSPSTTPAWQAWRRSMNTPSNSSNV